MEKKKCYISGKITDWNTGKPDQALIRQFKVAKEYLLSLGLEPVSPSDMEIANTGTWNECMKEAVKIMLECDAVFMLPNWRKSVGAVAEFNLANLLGMPVFDYSSDCSIIVNLSHGQ